jgi:uncharacterized protein YxeA
MRLLIGIIFIFFMTNINCFYIKKNPLDHHFRVIKSQPKFVTTTKTTTTTVAAKVARKAENNRQESDKLAAQIVYDLSQNEAKLKQAENKTALNPLNNINLVLNFKFDFSNLFNKNLTSNSNNNNVNRKQKTTTTNTQNKNIDYVLVDNNGEEDGVIQGVEQFYVPTSESFINMEKNPVETLVKYLQTNLDPRFIKRSN